MSRSPGGKSVGRVSIRVVPDTSKLRADLKKALERIERSEFLHIKPEITQKDQTKFRHQVRQMVKQASQNKVNIPVAANTTAAAAALRYVSRPRIVPLHVRVSRTSLATASALIARLSGARVAADWVERLGRSIANLDKNLPRMGFAISSITSLVAVLLSTISGLVGIGAGLTAMLPALLVLPGLFAGLITSAAILVVALSDARSQLAELGPSMTELRDIIREGFWSQARQPILDLVNNLMPQLRTAFRETATGIGTFIGGLARSFEKELGGGRFERIFAGMRRSFEILTTGTDAFAGAMVSLFLVAAEYVPRLSQWFVDMANRFDKWLKTTAEDGRLSMWIDEAIVAMNDLWRATTATGRVLQGIWRAAEAAGGGGLAGFADSLERMADAINGAPAQKAMTALFRGAKVATTNLMVGLRAFGRLLSQQSDAIEHFIGQAGGIFGDLLRDVSNALNNETVALGLTRFIDGLREGFRSFGDYLPRIALGLASLGEFAGELGRQLGPVLGQALASMAEIIGPFLDYLRTEVLPVLGPLLSDAITRITPSLQAFLEELQPIISTIVDLAERIIPELAKAIDDFAAGFSADTRIEDKAKAIESSIFGAFGEVTRFFLGSAQIIADLIAGYDDIDTQAALGTYGLMWQELQNVIYHAVENVRGFLNDLNWHFQGFLNTVANTLTTWYTTIRDGVTNFFAGAGEWLSSAGRNLIQGFINGIVGMIPALISAVTGVANEASKGIARALEEKSPSKVAHRLGAFFTLGFAGGIKSAAQRVVAASQYVATSAVTAPLRPDFSFLSSFARPVAEPVAESGPQVEVTFVNPVYRDSLKQLREEAEMIALGAWG